MLENKGKEKEKFSDLLKTSWVRSALKLGLVFAIIGLVILLILKILNIGSTQLFSDMKAFVAEYGLVGVFLATILAGTLVPLGSPALIVAAAVLGLNPILLIMTSTVAFTIGMMINYGLACRLGRPYLIRKMSKEKVEEIADLWSKWGWILYAIFGFIPVLPVELLSFICGTLKTRLDIFLILSFIPRLVVFTILAYFGEYVGAWMGAA